MKIIIFLILILLLFFIHLLYPTPKVESFVNKPFVGAWASVIDCGKGLKYVSLASALPQYWPDEKLFFSGNILGDYSSILKDKNTKYLLSIGGSNASSQAWMKLLADPKDTATKLYAGLKKRGLAGIDFDVEGTTPEMQSNIITLVSTLKNIDPSIIIQYTVLLGFPNTFNKLLADNQMDFVVLMLYNGGMYQASSTGAGCDWNQWAELYLSLCKTCPCKPLVEDCKQYCNSIGPMSHLKNKIILGVIVDTSGDKIDETGLKKAMDLCKKYEAAGIYFWVLPGWINPKSQSTVCDTLLTAMKKYDTDRYFDIGSCPTKCGESNGGPVKCQPSKNPCKTCHQKCVATDCGKKAQNVTDEQCAPCIGGKQTWWPCNQPGFCECSHSMPSRSITPTKPTQPSKPITPAKPTLTKPAKPITTGKPVTLTKPVQPPRSERLIRPKWTMQGYGRPILQLVTPTGSIAQPAQTLYNPTLGNFDKAYNMRY